MYKIHHTAKSFYSFSLDRLIYYVKIHKCDEKGAGVRWGLGVGGVGSPARHGKREDKKLNERDQKIFCEICGN